MSITASDEIELVTQALDDTPIPDYRNAKPVSWKNSAYKWGRLAASWSRHSDIWKDSWRT